MICCIAEDEWMKYNWKKALLYIVFGVPAIFFVMLFGTFHDWHIGSAFEERRYTLDMESIIELAKDYQVQNDVWTTLSDDAWITFALPRKEKVDNIEIEINFLGSRNSDKSQVYYARGGEIRGDSYVEAELVSGNNIIPFPSTSEICILRFDLTSIKGISFKLDHIILHYVAEKQILFWIVTPILMFIYMLIVIICVDKRIVGKFFGKRPVIRGWIMDVEQISSLAYSDFRSRFSGSYLGILWGIIQPMSTILLFWFVFQVGFRSNPVDDVPFILWLSAGMIPWNYFYDSWVGGTSTFVSYGYIVKKVVFKVQMLPIVKILSSGILNIFFNIILLCIYTLYGEFPGYHMIDMAYYSLCVMALSLGLSYVTATLNVFMKDIGQFLSIVLQFLMWLTPMMWDYHMLEEYSWFYRYNPLHYIINGYREALINGKWFFTNWQQMLWFWGITLLFCICGNKLMHRLKVHFADVL